MLRTIRPYEISVWTLQDSFLTTLKIPELRTRGHIEEPQMRLKTDGTEEIEFKVPMYYRDKGETIENPLWYDIKHGLLLVGLRKLKVIFNKGKLKEGVFEFLITEVKETHEEGQLYCSVKGSGLAFQELGKIGYNISLSSADYYNEYNEYYDSVLKRAEEEGLNDQEIQELLTKAPLNNLPYWCNKIFKNTDWTYSIQMDWYAHDGKMLQRITNNTSGTATVVDIAVVDKAQLGSEIGNREVISYTDLTEKQKITINQVRQDLGLRRYDTVYEDEYVASWVEKDSSLIPNEFISHKEKTRLVELKDGNIYNYSQTLAETFGVYCKYKYVYDDNYHIIGKEVVFYNNFIEEQEEQLDLTYPYSTSSISRTMDSNDICTKLFVEDVEDDSSPTGLFSISTTSANKSRENYILNFDYLYQTGSITKEQYIAVSEYERQMFILNTQLEPKAEQISALQTQINTYKANIAVLENSIILEQEQIDQANNLLKSITQNEGIITLNIGNANRGILLPDERENAAPNTYKIKLSVEGIIDDEEHKIKVYRTFSNGALSDQLEEKDFKIERDSNNNIVGLKDISPVDDNRIYYLIFSYRPRLHYENIILTYTEKLVKDTSEKNATQISLAKAEQALEKVTKQYDDLLEKKQSSIAEFEIMMGPALREGHWKPETYNNYGSKYYEKITLNSDNAITTVPKDGSNLMQLIWDEKPFDGEQLGYWEEGVNLEKKYYPCILLENYLNDEIIKDYLTSFKFTYSDNLVFEPQDHSFIIGSQLQFSFLKQHNKAIPVVLITGAEDMTEEELINLKNNPRFEVQIVNNDATIITKTLNINPEDIIMNYDEEDFLLVYPRIEIKSLSLKTSTDTFKLQMYDENSNLKTLEKYDDYSILIRQDSEIKETENSYEIISIESYLITPHLKVVFSGGSTLKTFIVSYEISNGDLNIYLDGLEVSKTNAFPKASYEVKVSTFNEQFLGEAYNQLGRIAKINDWELKFENVQGYVSELKLNLDRPEKDEVVIQNYRNKFEDLFSKIIASTEQIQKNGDIYNKAASAFNSNGIIKTSNLQSALDSSNLDYSFLNGDLTINEEEGIWGKSDEGVVAYTGGGIFTATSKDTNGNWLWNTGITPGGINASLLKAGQIDTNLIKIYSGSNLRFQMNGEGLFAYRAKESGEHNSNQYVVHNNEGLFLTALSGETINNIKLTEDIDRVAISWDGITLKNLHNEKVFYADEEGNLTLAGTIKAKDGQIGGWTIDKEALYSIPSENNKTTIFSGMASGPFKTNEISNILDEKNNIYKIFWAGSDNDSNRFYVDSTGVLHSSSVIVDNSLVAQNITLGNVSLNEVIDKVWERSNGIKVTPLNGTVFKINIGEEEPIENVLTFSLTGSEDLDFTQLGIINLMYFKKKSLEVDDPEQNEGDIGTPPSENEYPPLDFPEEDILEDNSESLGYWETVSSIHFNIIDVSSNYLTFSLNYSIMQEIGEDSVAFKIIYGYDLAQENFVQYDDTFDIQIIRDGKQGESPILVTIESSNGTVFKNKTIFTILTCKVMQGTTDITDKVKSFNWQKRFLENTESGSFDSSWPQAGTNSSSITITNEDIDDRAVFICEVEI